MATACDRNDGGRASPGTTLGVAVSLTEISTRVAFVAGLALFALLVIGWRKTARDSHRAPVGDLEAQPNGSPEVEYLSSSDVSRLAASKLVRIVGLGGIAVLVGILSALVVSLSLSWLVTNIIDRLR